MRRVPKELTAAIVALLLVLGMAACGGGDDSDSTAAEMGQQQAQTDTTASGDGLDDEGGADDEVNRSGDPDAGDFVPEDHDDSGGGSAQFKVEGGDNSVQEFGQEADSEELDAAAAALHNFLDARAEGNWAAACEYMSKSMTESFENLALRAKGAEATSCSAILEKLTNSAAEQSMKEEAAKADVGSLRIEDERAFVIYTGVDGTVMAMPMANEDGDWKVASLAGTPLS